MAFIPIKVADLRVGLFVTLEGSKEDNPFSEKEFKIQSSITLAVLKEIPHVRIFFDPDLSDLEPEIVESLHDTIEQDTSGDQPITVADSNLALSEFTPSPALYPAGQSSLTSDFHVDQSQPSTLEWEEGQDSGPHLGTQTSSTTESASNLEPLPEDLLALEPALQILEKQESTLVSEENPPAPVPEESVPVSEGVEGDFLALLEAALTSSSQDATASEEDTRDVGTQKVEDLPVPEESVPVSAEVEDDFPALLDVARTSSSQDATASEEDTREVEPQEVADLSVPEESVPVSAGVEGDFPALLEVGRTSSSQDATASEEDTREVEPQEVADLPVPVAAFSPPETDHGTPPEPIEATQNLSAPTLKSEQTREKDIEPEVSHDQPHFPSDDVSPHQEEQRQQDKPQVCQIQASDLDRAAYLYHHAGWQTKMALKRIFEGQGIGIKIAQQVTEDLQKALGNHETAGALIDLFGSLDSGDPFFTHAFNVCMLSLLVGREMDLEQSELSALGLGALLHDIGKLTSSGTVADGRPSGINAKNPDWLQHCQRGKEKAARFEAIPLASLDIIYQHHERLNGTGVPRGLKRNEISSLAKIVMVADEYDHLCHQPDPSDNLSPSQALSHLYYREIIALQTKQSGGADPWFLDGELSPTGPPASSPQFPSKVPKETASGLSGDVFTALVKALGVYPPGSIVELTNGTLGLVTGVNFEMRTKPPIMLYEPDLPQADARMCDLAKEKSLHIVKSIPLQQLPPNVREYLYAERFV